MTAISRRGQGGRILNICVRAIHCGKCALNPPTSQPIPRRPPSPSQHNDTPAPSTSFACPRTATRPPQALPLLHAAPTHAHWLRDAFPAVLTTHSPPKTFARPEHFRSPAQRHAPSEHFRLAHAAPMHARWLRDAFPAEGLRPPPLSDTPFPSTSALPRSPNARPPTVRCTPRRSHNPFPTEGLRPPPHSDTPAPSVPLRAQKNGTAQCMCDAECLGRPSCGRSFGLVSRALFAAVAGRWRVGVGLRPQPWALRSRRCGRVLRA